MVFMGYSPQESLQNTINTMGTLLGVHPILPWTYMNGLNLWHAEAGVFHRPNMNKTPLKKLPSRGEVNSHYWGV